MINKIKTFIAVAALSGTVGANAQAAMIAVKHGDTLPGFSDVHNTSVENVQKLDDLSVEKLGSKMHNTSRRNINQVQGWNKLFLMDDRNSSGLSVAANQFAVVQPTIPASGQSVQQETSGVTTNTILQSAGQVQTALAPALPAGNLLAEAANTAQSEEQTKAAAAQDQPANNVSVTDTQTVGQTDTTAIPEPQTAGQTDPAVATPSQPVEQTVPPATQPAGQSASASTPAAPPVGQTETQTIPAGNPAPASDSGSKEITVKATAYTASCDGCSGITKTGVNIKANPDEKVIAVDPSVIPLGSKVFVEGVGEATAADTGGAIKGNRIDVFIPSEQAALNFGVKELKVTILN